MAMPAAPMDDSSPPAGERRFRTARTLRLGTFHIGSAMSDVLVSSVLNRVLISHFGFMAWPVALLLGLRYLLSPLSLWAGARSDISAAAPFGRTRFIWAGRALMMIGLGLIGISLAWFGRGQAVPGWLIVIGGFLAYGVGGLISGSPFLALVRHSVPAGKQGMAIAIVETVLIACFPLAALGFGLLMEHYELRLFWRLVALTTGVGGLFWLVSIAGVERRVQAELRAAGEPVQPHDRPLRERLRTLLGDRSKIRFFLFLSVAAAAAWLQEAVLEPFGAEVLELSLGQTTRLNTVWLAPTLLTLVASMALWRNRPPERQGGIAGAGLCFMAAGMALLAAAAFARMSVLVMPALIAYGAGFGVYTFGGLSLMAAMTTDQQAGAELGLWTIAQVVFRGVGIGAGGMIRDVGLVLGGSPAVAYGVVFAVASAGIVAAVAILTRVAEGLRARPGSAAAPVAVS